MRIFFKARALPQGAVRTWADGIKRKKVGHKWVPVGEEEKVERGVDIRAKSHYDLLTRLDIPEATANLRRVGVTSFEDLKTEIKEGPYDTAHKIFRAFKDRMDAENITKYEKQISVDSLGRALIGLRNQYARKPKTALTVKKVSAAGKTYYKPKEKEEKLPVLKATALSAAKKKLGGWTDMNKPPSGSQVATMVRNKTAKVTVGKPDSRKKWQILQARDDVIVPWKPNETGITITMKQVRQVKQRTWRTAQMEVKIPYAYAKQFLMKQIESDKTRRNLIGQLERSQGYQTFIKEKAK